MTEDRSETGESHGAAGWEPVEHTADLGLAVWAPSLEELFATAARGTLSLALDLERVVPRDSRRIEVRGMDREELLVAWLQELLYLWTVRGFVASRFRARILPPRRQESEEPWRLRADVEGEAWDPGRHEAYTDIKAVTYHDLRIREEKDPGGRPMCRVVLILDT